jgi:DNA repair exonuclease SbcCD ATPase subunit
MGEFAMISTNGLRACIFVVAALMLAALPPPVALAQTDRPAQSTQPDALTPVEEFSRKLEEFKQSIPELNKKIDESAAAVDRWSDVAQARKQIEDLRSIVSSALGAVSDNGTVSQLGVKALNHANEKLKALEQDTRFKPEERQFLIDQWRKLRAQTERATEELGTARKEFTELLRSLQTNEDFIDELVQIRQAQKALDVIRELTKNIREASDQLKTLIGSIKPPGA